MDFLKSTILKLNVFQINSEVSVDEFSQKKNKLPPYRADYDGPIQIVH